MNIKNALKKKFKKSKGFTLIEMLIVVAIIAILVAVSIPTVSSSLDKAKVNTDMANERAAKAAAVITYMTDGNFNSSIDYYYDAGNGKLVEKSEIATNNIAPYGQCSSHKNGIIKVNVSDNGDVTISWVNSKSSDAHTHTQPKP